jgi:hypothetical protein
MFHAPRFTLFISHQEVSTMRSRNRLIRLSKFLAVAALFLAWHFSSGIVNAEIGDDIGEEWPQWRGPNRDGISHETGFLKNWPEDGPNVLWRIPIGDGFSAIAISQGHIYTMSAEGDNEFVICLDASNGEEIWRCPSGSKFTEERGDGPRSMPTVDGDWVFALGAEGKLYALDARNGEK